MKMSAGPALVPALRNSSNILAAPGFTAAPAVPVARIAQTDLVPFWSAVEAAQHEQTAASSSSTDQNAHHSLLPECVLHNVLSFLVIREAYYVALTAQSFCGVALRAPHVSCCFESPAKDGALTLNRVLSCFQNSVSTFHVGDMSGIPVSNEKDRGKGVSGIVHKQMTAVFNNLDNLRELSMRGLRLDPSTFDGFVSALDRYYTNPDFLGPEDGEPGRIAKLVSLELSGALYPRPQALLDNLCNKLSSLHLKKLTLEGCRTLDDSCLNAIVAHCKVLERLCVAGATRLKRPSFSHPHLRIIDVSRCTNLQGFESFNAPCARELHMVWCRKLEDSAVHDLFASGNSPCLSLVDLDGCISLRSLVISPPSQKTGMGIPALTSLRYLRVGMCEDLASLKVASCPNLYSLELDLCLGLCELDVESQSLRELSLALLPKLQCIRLNCPKLETLDLTRTGVSMDEPFKAVRRVHRKRYDCVLNQKGVLHLVLECDALPSFKVIDDAQRVREGDGPTATGLGYGMHADEEHAADSPCEAVHLDSVER